MEPKKSDTEKLLESYATSINQIIMGKPDLIFLRSKRLDDLTKLIDPGNYPNSLYFPPNIEYIKIMVRTSIDNSSVAYDKIKFPSQKIYGNKQTTYDIVYERQTQINED